VARSDDPSAAPDGADGSAPRPGRTLFRGGRVLDAASGTLAEADVVIADGLVVDVGPGLDGDDVVECAGASVLPGLIDAHVHVAITGFDVPRWLAQPAGYSRYEALETLRTYLGMGITTVRDAGGADAALQLAVDRGLVAGPRLRIAVTMLSQTGGHGDPTTASGLEVDWLPSAVESRVDGVDEVRRRVRELVRAGADQIKVAVSGGVLSPLSDPRRPQLSLEELTVMVAEAAAAGRDVMAHAHGAAGIVNGIRAGVRSIEHGTLLTDEAIGLMLERGTWLVPTLLAPQGVLDAAAAGVALSDLVVAKAQSVLAEHRVSFARAVAAGVQVAMGTDCPVSPHGTNLGELPLMAAGGMTPGAVLQAATLGGARLMRLDDELGSLEPGKRADVVVLDGDALDLADVRERVRETWKDGVRLYARAA